MKKIVVLNDADNVATSLEALEAGAEVSLTIAGETLTFNVSDEVPFGHKIAIRAMGAGDEVTKYGEIIGKASRDVSVGEWVHTHNVESARARGDLAVPS
jgi:altronate dehydratase small subunit